MTRIAEQKVKIVDTDSSSISLNIKQLGAVGAMPVAPNELKLAGNTAHTHKFYSSIGAVTDGIIWSPDPAKRMVYY